MRTRSPPWAGARSNSARRGQELERAATAIVRTPARQLMHREREAGREGRCNLRGPGDTKGPYAGGPNPPRDLWHCWCSDVAGNARATGKVARQEPLGQELDT